VKTMGKKQKKKATQRNKTTEGNHESDDFISC